MIVETYDQSKCEKLRKTKNKLSSVKTSEHIPVEFRFASVIISIFVILVKIVWIFLLKRWIRS